MDRFEESHSAVILQRGDPHDAALIDRLVADGALVQDISVAADELAGLVPPLTERDIAEPTRFAYFGWRNTLVQLPGPRMFERIRLDRNRFKITPAEQARLRSISAGVVGLSSGFAVAMTIALDGLCGRLRLADFDTVELPNLNRIAMGLFEIGTNKAVAAARRIAELDPYLPIEVRPGGVTADDVDDFVAGLDVILEQSDSFDIKIAVRESARRHRVPVIMQTNDRGLLDVERFDLEPDRPLFHGLLGDLDAAQLRSLPPQLKTQLLLQVIDGRQASARGAASLLELGRTVGGWPQLGSETQFGGAVVAKAVQRIGLGQPLASGRIRVDPDEVLNDLAPPPLPAPPDPEPVSRPAMSPAPARSPADSLPEPVRAIAEAAIRAPSGGNSQPWRISVDATGLRIVPAPVPSSLDIHGRGSLMAVGAALFNARVAAAARHLLGPWRVECDGDWPVAELSFVPGGFDPDLAGLYAAMMDRGSNRNPGRRDVLDPALVDRMAAAARAEGAVLHLVDDAERLAGLGQVLGASDRIRFLTPHLHHDMVAELSWPGRDRLDVGIDVRTLGLGPATGVLDLITRADVMRVLSDIDGGSLIADLTVGRIATASAVAVVTVAGDSPKDYLLGGLAVERVWIEATSAGLGVTPISPAFLYARTPHDLTILSMKDADQLAELQRTMSSLMGFTEGQVPVLLVRFAHSPEPTVASLRRPLSEVMISSDNTDGTC